jgi:hypothetical protein
MHNSSSAFNNTAEERNAFMLMLKKDGQVHRVITDGYLTYRRRTVKPPNTQEAREGRKAQYASPVNK